MGVTTLPSPRSSDWLTSAVARCLGCGAIIQPRRQRPRRRTTGGKARGSTPKSRFRDLDYLRADNLLVDGHFRFDPADIVRRCSIGTGYLPIPVRPAAWAMRSPSSSSRPTLRPSPRHPSGARASPNGWRISSNRERMSSMPRLIDGAPTVAGKPARPDFGPENPPGRQYRHQRRDHCQVCRRTSRARRRGHWVRNAVEQQRPGHRRPRSLWPAQCGDRRLHDGCLPTLSRPHATDPTAVPY